MGNLPYSPDKKRAYYAANRDRFAAYARKAYAKRKEEILASNKAWRDKTPRYWEKRSDPLNHGPKRRFQIYKHGAKKRGIVFLLTFQEFMSLWAKPCWYCGSGIPTIGIDRVDAELGYVLSNVVPCCSGCNYAKKSCSQAEYIARCARVANLHGGR